MEDINIKLFDINTRSRLLLFYTNPTYSTRSINLYSGLYIPSFTQHIKVLISKDLKSQLIHRLKTQDKHIYCSEGEGEMYANYYIQNYKSIHLTRSLLLQILSNLSANIVTVEFLEDLINLYLLS